MNVARACQRRPLRAARWSARDFVGNWISIRLLVVVAVVVVIVVVVVVVAAVVVVVHFKNEKPLFGSAECHSRIHLSGATSAGSKQLVAARRSWALVH